MAATNGSRQTIEDLYLRYGGSVRRYLARIVGDVEAEDLVHDVFERAQRGFAEHRGDARVSTWLFRIATHAAIDRLRARAFHGRRLASLAADDGVDDATESPDATLARAETRSCILGLVDQLPESLRAVVLLGEMQGLGDREVGEALGISTGAAKIRLHRAKAKLREVMSCACHVHRDERDELACEPAEPPLRVVA